MKKTVLKAICTKLPVELLKKFDEKTVSLGLKKQFVYEQMIKYFIVHGLPEKK